MRYVRYAKIGITRRMIRTLSYGMAISRGLARIVISLSLQGITTLLHPLATTER